MSLSSLLLSIMQPAIAIICAGGPALGINTVVSSVAKIILKEDYNGGHGLRNCKTIFSKSRLSYPL